VESVWGVFSLAYGIAMALNSLPNVDAVENRPTRRRLGTIERDAVPVRQRLSRDCKGGKAESNRQFDGVNG
jgi:hypothetical protein